MASPQGREMAGWAFRAGANYKPAMLVDQANKQQQANQAAQQKAIADKRKESQKFLEKAATLDKSALSEPYQKYKMKKASELLDYSKGKLMKNDGMLSSEDQLEILEMKNNINNEVELLESYDRGLKDIQNTILRDKNLYNMEEVSEYLLIESQKALTENGLNPDFSLSDLQNSLQDPNFLNASAVFEQFTDRIEEQELTDIDGNEKRSVTMKFAEWDADKNKFAQDANGNVMVKITPETVSLAKKDTKVKAFMDANIAKAKAEGIENYTYTDALREYVSPFQKKDVKQTNKTPRASSGAQLNKDTYRWGSAANVAYLDEPDGDRFGTRPMEFPINGLKASQNITLEDENGNAVKGDGHKLTLSGDKQPKIQLSTRGIDAGSAEFKSVPFNKLNYNVLLSNAKSKEEREILKDAWNGRNSSVGDVYANPKIKEGLSETIGSVLKKQTTKTFWGAERAYDERSEEEFTQQVHNALSEAGVEFEKDEIIGEPGRYGSDNYINYNGEKFYEEDISSLVTAIFQNNKNNPKLFLDENRYKKLTEEQPEQKTESSKALSEEERLKKI